MSAAQTLLDRVKAKRQSFAAKSNTLKPIKLASAKNLIRILPNWGGDPDGTFFHDFANHYIKDSKGETKAVYVCTQMTFGRECDICSEVAQLMSETTDEAALKILADARASTRILVNAIVPTGTHANAKTDPHLTDLPQSVFDEMLAALVNAQEQDNINIFDLEEGHDFTVSKTGSGRDTRYGVTLNLKPRKVDPSVLEKCIDIEKYVQQEYEQGKLKALSQLRGTATALGITHHRPDVTLLAGPNATYSKPGGGNGAALAAAEPMDLADEGIIESTATVVTKPAPTKPAVTAPAAVVAPVVVEEAAAELDELEQMLAELDQ